MFKGVMQNDINDCGAACLSTICKHYGYHESLAFFRDSTKTTSEGASMYALTVCAQNIGFNSEVLYGTWDEFIEEIKPDKLPVIVHTVGANRLAHYLVIKKIKGNKIYIFDPAKGNVVFEQKSFQSIWTGYIITFEPNKKLFCSNTSRREFFKYFKLLKENYKIFSLTVFLSMILTVLMIISSIAYKVLIDDYIVGNIKMAKEGIIKFFLALIFLYFICMVIYIIRGFMLAKINKNMYTTLLRDLYTKIVKLPISFFDMRKDGEIVNRYTLVKGVVNTMANSIIIIILESFLAFITLGLLFYFDKDLAIVVLGTSFLYCFIVVIYKPILKRDARNSAESESELLSCYTETIDHIETIKIFNQQQQCSKKFLKLTQIYLRRKIRLDKDIVVKSGLENTVERIGNVFVLSIGTFYVVRGTISLGTLIAFQALTTFFLNPLRSLTEIQGAIQNMQIACRRIDDILDSAEEINNRENIERVDSIEFQNVSFSYNYNQEVLKSISFKVQRGDWVGLIGKSGSGKSTVAKLILKFYQIDDGMIRISDRNIDNLNIHVLREKVIYISQKSKLFSGKLRDNLTFYKDVSDEVIQKILGICQLELLIEKFKHGLDTEIEEEGKNLSVGEIQRINIARALLLFPDCIIFDEATSNLDKESESKIWDAIKRNYPEMIVFIISHDNNVIKNCEKIIKIEEGKIQEEVDL